MSLQALFSFNPLQWANRGYLGNDFAEIGTLSGLHALPYLVAFCHVVMQQGIPHQMLIRCSCHALDSLPPEEWAEYIFILFFFPALSKGFIFTWSKT